MIRRLQTPINTAARIVSGRSRFSRITNFVRDDLHWLPVSQRVSFKIATSVYNIAPQYITDMIASSTTVIRRDGMRSSSKLSLIVPRHVTKFAERALTAVGSSLCNGPLQDIRVTRAEFRKLLKRHFVWRRLFVSVKRLRGVSCLGKSANSPSAMALSVSVCVCVCVCVTFVSSAHILTKSNTHKWRLYIFIFAIEQRHC